LIGRDLDGSPRDREAPKGLGAEGGYEVVPIDMSGSTYPWYGDPADCSGTGRPNDDLYGIPRLTENSADLPVHDLCPDWVSSLFPALLAAFSVSADASLTDFSHGFSSTGADEDMSNDDRPRSTRYTSSSKVKC
jgi:hypothetical protein